MSTVTEYLAGHHIEFRTYEHPRAETANQEARELGVPSDEVAKTLALRTPSGYVLAVIPASRRLDFRRAAEAVGTPHVELASEKEIAAAFPGYELGAIPPFSDLLGVAVYVAEELSRREWLIFASGRQSESIKVHTADLLRDGKTTVAVLCRPYPTFDEDWME